ncbi:UNVERIFIED_CONTAM: hypothetical protein LK11_14170, partial [Mumia flava]
MKVRRLIVARSPPGPAYDHAAAADGGRAAPYDRGPDRATDRGGEPPVARTRARHGTVPSVPPVRHHLHLGGGALYERMAYDEHGQLQNASFMDFLMPYVTEVPTTIDVDHLETPSPLNPLGIKGAGEA